MYEKGLIHIGESSSEDLRKKGFESFLRKLGLRHIRNYSYFRHAKRRQCPPPAHIARYRL